MNQTDTGLFGLLGLTHGGARILTVIGDRRVPDWFERLNVSESEFRIVRVADQRQPVQLHERVDGAIGRLIRAHTIKVLTNIEWARMKERRSTS